VKKRMVKKNKILGLVLLLFISLIAVIPVSAAPTNMDFGYSPGYVLLTLDDTELDTYLNNMAETGAAYIRIDIDWSVVQGGGRYSWNWTNTDRVFNAIINKGFKILALPTSAPSWVGVPPESSQYYGDFVYEAGKRYIPLGVVDWELWNEANIQGFTPATYVDKILIPGSNKIRQAASELGKTVTVVSTGLAPAETGGGSNGDHYSQKDFVAGIYAHGGKNYFDALGQHPYTWPRDPAVMDPWNWLLKTQELRDIMVENGDSAKKIWSTENGYPTNAGTNGISEELQRDYTLSAYDIWKGWSWTGGPYFFYSYKDIGTDNDNPEHFFGMVRYNGTEKPVLQAVKDLIAGNPIEGQKYQLVNRNSGKVLAIGASSLLEGAQAVQWENLNIDDQKWTFVLSGSNYKIKNVNSGKILSIADGSTNDGVTVVQKTDWGASDQRWELVSIGGGYYKIVNERSNKLMAIEGASTSNGAGAIQWRDTGGFEQHWKFVKVN
jgi:hypothetical protein